MKRIESCPSIVDSVSFFNSDGALRRSLLKLVPGLSHGASSAGLLADTTLGDPFASDLGPAPVGEMPGTLPSSSSGTDLDSGALPSRGGLTTAFGHRGGR